MVQFIFKIFTFLFIGVYGLGAQEVFPIFYNKINEASYRKDVSLAKEVIGDLYRTPEASLGAGYGPTDREELLIAAFHSFRGFLPSVLNAIAEEEGVDDSLKDVAQHYQEKNIEALLKDPAPSSRWLGLDLAESKVSLNEGELNLMKEMASRDDYARIVGTKVPLARIDQRPPTYRIENKFSLPLSNFSGMLLNKNNSLVIPPDEDFAVFRGIETLLDFLKDHPDSKAHVSYTIRKLSPYHPMIRELQNQLSDEDPADAMNKVLDKSRAALAEGRKSESDKNPSKDPSVILSENHSSPSSAEKTPSSESPAPNLTPKAEPLSETNEKGILKSRFFILVSWRFLPV